MTEDTNKSTEDKPTPAQEEKKKKGVLKWLALIVGGLFLLLVVLILSFYLILKSGTLTQSAVPKLKPYLEPLGLEIHKIGSLRFDLLKNIELQNLELDWHDPELGNAKLAVGSFKLEYSFWDLLDNRLLIQQISLADLEITTYLLQTDDKKPKKLEEEKSEPLTLNDIEKLLQNPPLLIDVNTINLTNILFDITLDQTEGQLRYQGKLNETNMELFWQPTLLSGLVRVQLGDRVEENQLSIPALLNNNKIKIDVSPKIDLAINWRLENNKKQWHLSESKVDVIGELRKFKLVDQNQANKSPLVAMNLFDLQLANTLSSSQDTNKSSGLENLFPIKLDSSISSRLLDLNVDQFKQQDLLLDTKVNHEIKLLLNGLVNPFAKKIPDLKFSLEESLQIGGLKLRIEDQLIRSDKITWNLRTGGETADSKTNTSMLDANISADSNLGTIKYDKPESKESGPGLSLTINPNVRLEGNVKLASFNDPLENLIAKLQPEIELKNLFATIKEEEDSKDYKIANTKLALNVNYDNKNVNLISNFDVNRAKVPEINKEFSLNNVTNIDTDLDVNKLNLDTRLKLDTNQLMKLSLALKNKAKILSLQHEINLNLTPELSKYHDAANELKIIGAPEINLKGDTKILHNADDVLEADFSLIEHWPIETLGKIEVIQHERPTVEEGINLSGPVNVNYSLNNKNNYQIDVDLNVEGVKTPPLETFLPIAVTSTNNLTWPLTTTRSTIQLKINDEKALDVNILAHDKKHDFELETELAVHTNPAWQVYLKDLKELESIGKLSIHTDLDSKLKHPFINILEFDPEKIDKLALKTRVDTAISQQSGNPGKLLVLPKQANIKQNLLWSKDNLVWEADLAFPELQLPDIVNVRDIHSTINVKANSGLTPTNAQIKVGLGEGYIKLLAADKEQAEMELGSIVTPLQLESAANWTETDVNLENLDLNIGRNLLAFSAQGSASIDGKNVQIESQISSRLRENIFIEPAVSGSGDIQLPLRFTMLEGNQLAVEGQIKFDEFNLKLDELNINNVNGTFALEEELLLENESVKFRYLLEPNPFQRVDFTRIQPYLNTSSISIDQISTPEMEIGPILANVLVKQNLFSLQQFDIDLFSGHSAGQFYLDIRPDAWKLGLLTRITNLDPRLLLTKESKLRDSELSPINTRTAIEFDIHKRLMEGEIIVSQINQLQLLQLLDVVDPTHEDEQMAQLRKGLRVSHPESVEIDMQRGLMNLKVEIAGIPKAIKVTGLPLTPMIQQFASDALAEIDKLPIQ